MNKKIKIIVTAVAGVGMYSDDYYQLAQYEVPPEVWEEKKQQLIEFWKEDIKQQKQLATQTGMYTKFPVDVRKLVIEADKERVEVGV